MLMILTTDLNIVQLLSPNGWQIFFDTFESSFQGCAVAIDVSTFIVIQGRNQATPNPGRTFMINVETNTVREGPLMLTGRSNAACSRMMNQSTSSPIVVVAGGVNENGTAINSTEILDTNSFKDWILGL